MGVGEPASTPGGVIRASGSFPRARAVVRPTEAGSRAETAVRGREERWELGTAEKELRRGCGGQGGLLPSQEPTEGQPQWGRGSDSGP